MAPLISELGSQLSHDTHDEGSVSGSSHSSWNSQSVSPPLSRRSASSLSSQSAEARASWLPDPPQGHSRTSRTELSRTTPEIVRIDREIAYHLKSVLELRHERNKHIQINQLPPEILYRIFRFVSNDAIRYDWHPPHRFLRAVAFSHVCKHWRGVALSHKRLWTTVRLTGVLQRWTDELLKRSRGASITVTIDPYMSVDAYPSANTKLLDNLWRIRHLTLTHRVEVLSMILFELRRPAPILESLSLTSLSDRFAATRLPLAFTTGDGSPPRLRRLYVAGSMVDLSSPFFSRLTSLELRKIPESSRPSMRTLLRALKGMPGLERLVLYQALPSASGLVRDLATEAASEGNDGALAEDPSVVLEQLDELALHGPVIRIAALFFYLSFPPSTRLRLDCGVLRTTEQDAATSVISWVAAHWKREGLPLRSWAVRDDADTLVMLFYLDERPPGHPPRDTDAHAALRWRCDPLMAAVLYAEACKQFAFDKLHSLFVSTWSPTPWEEAFADAPLKELTVISVGATGLVKALTVEPPPPLPVPATLRKGPASPPKIVERTSSKSSERDRNESWSKDETESAPKGKGKSVRRSEETKPIKGDSKAIVRHKSEPMARTGSKSSDHQRTDGVASSSRTEGDGSRTFAREGSKSKPTARIYRRPASQVSAWSDDQRSYFSDASTTGRAARTPSKPAGASLPPPPFLPTLQTLSIRHLDFAHPPVTLGELGAMLESRRDLGRVRLRRLQIHRCRGFTAEAGARLIEDQAVDVVDWDTRNDFGEDANPEAMDEDARDANETWGGDYDESIDGGEDEVQVI